MGQFVKENAHLKTDPKKLADNWTHVYDRKNCECEYCKPKELEDFIDAEFKGEET